MDAIISKVGNPTSNGNIILTLSVENGVVNVFGVDKPKKTTYLMAIPQEEAEKLEVGQKQSDFPLNQFEVTERPWEDEDGKTVTNLWLHARA